MELTNTISGESKGFYKLSWLQRIGFGSGDLAQNLIFQTTCMYLLFFYTDIYGLDAEANALQPRQFVESLGFSRDGVRHIHYYCFKVIFVSSSFSES